MEQVCTCINYVASIFAAFLCSNVVIGNDYYCPSCPLQPCSGVGMETSARCMHVKGQEGGREGCHASRAVYANFSTLFVLSIPLDKEVLAADRIL